MIAVGVALAIGALAPASCGLENVAADYEEQQGIQCGWVSVPLRADEPNGRLIRLWTARIRGTGTTAEDPVVYINGGPGVATVDAILPNLTQNKTIALLRQGRDVILFDQRGSARHPRPILRPAERRVGQKTWRAVTRCVNVPGCSSSRR